MVVWSGTKTMMLTSWGRRSPVVALGLILSGCASHELQVGDSFMFVPSRPAVVAPAAPASPPVAATAVSPMPVSAQPLPPPEEAGAKAPAAPLRLVPSAGGTR